MGRIKISERIRLALANTARNCEKVLRQDEKQKYFNQRKLKSVEKIQECQTTKKSILEGMVSKRIRFQYGS